jgi:hypothetical protein
METPNSNLPETEGAPKICEPGEKTHDKFIMISPFIANPFRSTFMQ